MTSSKSQVRLAFWLPLTLCLLHQVLSGTSAALTHSDQTSAEKLESDSSAAQRFRRASKFVRIGKPSSFVRIGRANSFVRIGKDATADEGEFSDLADDPGYAGLDKRFSKFVRIGKTFPMHRFIRIGRAPSSEGFTDEYADISKRPNSFVRIGKSDMSSAGDDGYEGDSDRLYSLPEILKRASHFVRIGKGASNFVRIGRPSSFVRIGKNDQGDYVGLDKRANSFVRIGKNLGLDFDEQGFVKRPSSFVRIGKDVDGDDKRASSFVRIGKGGDGEGIGADQDKRASSFVRIGKGDSDKRASSFVRIGKGDADKRASSFVRIGKGTGDYSPAKPAQLDAASASSHTFPSPTSEELEDAGDMSGDKPINLANRSSAFVRIGKIPSSAFVRIGKNTEVMMDPLAEQKMGYRRGSRGGQSNFVRIG